MVGYGVWMLQPAAAHSKGQLRVTLSSRWAHASQSHVCLYFQLIVLIQNASQRSFRAWVRRCPLLAVHAEILAASFSIELVDAELGTPTTAPPNVGDAVGSGRGSSPVAQHSTDCRRHVAHPGGSSPRKARHRQS